MTVVNLSGIKRGETWNGFVLNLTDSLSAPIDLTGSLIKMDVKNNACETESVLSFSSEDSTIDVFDAINGSLQVLPLVIDINPKNYTYDLKIVLSDTTVIYPIGGNFTVIKNITR